jgi:deoxycytidylate deaminase
MLDSFRKYLQDMLDEVECRSRSIASIIVKNGVIIGRGTNNPTCNCVDNARALGYEVVDDGKTCVRYLLGAKSGQMLHLCNARHSERTAINDAHNHGFDTNGASIYMTCECPCHLCASAIVNAGISSIFIKDKKDYDPRGREILNAGGVIINTWDI